jgi:hypothetical protein
MNSDEVMTPWVCSVSRQIWRAGFSLKFIIRLPNDEVILFVDGVTHLDKFACRIAPEFEHVPGTDFRQPLGITIEVHDVLQQGDAESLLAKDGIQRLPRLDRHAVPGLRVSPWRCSRSWRSPDRLVRQCQFDDIGVRPGWLFPAAFQNGPGQAEHDQRGAEQFKFQSRQPMGHRCILFFCHVCND